MTARHRFYVGAIATASVFTFLAIYQIASAHEGNNDPNVIHACVGKDSKIARIVGVAGSCTQAETAVHWGIQGSPGTPGLKGTNGTNGTNGTSVTFGGPFSGNAYGCPNGGVIYIQSDGDNWTNTYVCNGLNAAATTRPDPPCFDNSHRYVNCGNGTMTDTVTGLIWLRQADCLAFADYAGANHAAAGLKHGDCGLTDQSSPGDWRLPTQDEWSATIERAVALGCKLGNAPSLTNDAGTGCVLSGVGRRLRASCRAAIGRVPPMCSRRTKPGTRTSASAPSPSSTRSSSCGCGRCEAERAESTDSSWPARQARRLWASRATRPKPTSVSVAGSGTAVNWPRISPPAKFGISWMLE